MKYKSLTHRQFLSVIIAPILISVSIIGAKIMTDPIKPWMGQENWTDLAPRNATVTVRGIVKEVKPNHISYGLISYHIFPAVIVLNITEVVWMSDEVHAFLKEINNTFYNSFWKVGNLRSIGYDFKEAPNLVQDDFLEVSGYWLYTTDSAYSMKLIVAPNVNGSYIKPLP